MKKLVLIIAALVAVGVGAFFVVTNKDNGNKTNATGISNQKDRKVTIESCKIFSLEDAKKLLGPTAQQGAENTTVDSDNLAVGICSYFVIDRSASMLLRVPKNQTGADSNSSQFTSQKPPGVEDVKGYGDAAFWNPKLGQLNILYHDIWVVISNGPIQPALRNIDDAKKVADLILSKL